jgi:ABC-type iron transport system FetAB permease component
MIWVILTVILAIGAIAGWLIVARLPKNTTRSRFDRAFIGTIVAFGTILALNVVWFVAGCIARVPGVPLICT